MTRSDPAVAAVLNVAFAQIQATAAAVLADVPARLLRAEHDAASPEEQALLATARLHVARQGNHLAQDFGHSLRGRVQGDLQAAGAQPGNPLRAAVIGWAMNRAIQKLTPDPGVARVLARHTGFALATAMADCRRRIAHDLQVRGIGHAGSANSVAHGDPSGTCDAAQQLEQAALLEQLMRGETPSAWVSLSHNASESVDDSGHDPDSRLTQVLRSLNCSEGSDSEGNAGSHAADRPPQNLIRRHRAALEQAASGPLDKLVIGITCDLFDAVVADPQVPRPVAAVLAPLQLPVLRVAMRDPGFFASDRHPVRRFIDRVASLGQARDDLDSEIGRGWLARVGGLVKQIVTGDFHQTRLYDRQLQELERITDEAARAEVEAGAAGATVQAKEADWQRLSALSAHAGAALAPLPLPSFVQNFLALPWCHLIVGSRGQAATDGSDGADPGVRWQRVAAELAASVLPKRTLDERRRFAASLPGLMASLQQGLAWIDWPADLRRAFFDQLMAAHAASMRAPVLPDAEFDRVARQLAVAFVLPGATDGSMPSPATTLRAPDLEHRFDADEARRVGLLREQDVAWAGPAEASPPLSECLQVGACYRLLRAAQWQQVRLTYMAPGRNFFMFSHGAKQRQTISMTARMVDRLCAASRLVAGEAAPLLDRATARVRALATASFSG